jgi:mono/diheme cytochrome c family protein
MRFTRDAIVTVVVLIVVACLVTYSRLRAGGLSAEAAPGPVERAIAPRLARLSIPSDARSQENPLRNDTAVWRSAVDHYRDHCALCHGDDGRGHTTMGENMYPKVPDFADPIVQRMTDGELFYVIQNGVRWTGMPAWKREHSTDDTWRLVSLVRTVPTLTHEELESSGLASEAEHHEHEHHEHEHHEDGHTTETPRSPKR